MSEYFGGTYKGRGTYISTPEMDRFLEIKNNQNITEPEIMFVGVEALRSIDYS